MNTYIIKYILQHNRKEKNIVNCITIDFENDKIAIDTVKDFQSKGNYIKELYNKSTDTTLYHHKKAKFNNTLD